MLEKKTHRQVSNPQISARFLADYMAASEQAKRTIVRSCKYQPLARLLQHDEAKQAVGKYLRNGSTDPESLIDAAQRLRDRIADDDFDRTLFDTNADYIDRFATIRDKVALPSAEILVPGKTPALLIDGVKVTAEIQFRLQRLTKTNKIRVGAATLRYGKGKPLSDECGAWQSSFLFGYLGVSPPDEAAEPEGKLCITIDAYTGKAHAAPGDAATRFKNMKAACASIAERWPNIAPPHGARL